MHSRSFRLGMSLALAFVVAALGCGDDVGPGDAAADASSDGSLDAATDDAASDGGVCGARCATDLAIVIDGTAESADVAYFGRNADATIRVEAYGEAAVGCPTMDSPTPARTVIIPSIALPFGASQDVAVTLLDFEGTLTMEPVLTATAATVTDGLELVDGSVVFDLDAAFAAGTISGIVHATHCASLDE